MNIRKYKSKDGRVAVVTKINRHVDIIVVSYICDHDGAFENQIEVNAFLDEFKEIK